MALRTRRDKPIEELTDKHLRQRLARSQKTIDDLPTAADGSQAERKAALARGTAAAQEVPQLRAELKRRERYKQHRELETKMARGAIERTREVLSPGVMEGFQRLGQEVGLRKLDPKRLDADERGTVLKLWSAVDAGDASIEERTEFEALVEKAAGQEPGFFDKRRKEAQTKRQLADLKEEAHVTMLPRRRRFEEAGSVTLPRVVFAWLQQAKGNDWSVADVATVAVLLSCFEEQRSLVESADFEQGEDGEPVLVGRGPLAKWAFTRRINPHIQYSVGSTGWVDLGASLKRLAANGWVDVREVARGRTEIKLGPAARELLDRDHQ
ncbi:MAG: hypothetical protein H0T97_09885 [Actinobacteria bacterium]|nr:hypothetical protein [Actinomycetota bacterium]